MRRNLTPADLTELLDGQSLAILATQRPDHGTLLSPVWHEWHDGGFSIVIGADDRKARALVRDPRCTVLVAEHAPPYRSLEVSGSAELSCPADIRETTRRIAIRYLGEEGGGAYADALAGEALTLVRVVPGKLRAWDFSDEMG
jgi:PPOX class probable F420-dependent enzyme